MAAADRAASGNPPLGGLCGTEPVAAGEVQQ